MMNCLDWKYYYKIDQKLTAMPSNMLYSPKINDSGDILCMHYCKDNTYRQPNDITEEVIDFFFKRELRFLTELKDLDFTPTILEVNEQERQIFIEWNHETLSQIVNDSSRSIDKEIPDWKEQLYKIITGLDNRGYFKVALYPHCFFVDKNKKIKTIDYYAVVPKNERFIERSIIESIIGKDGAYRFNESTVDGMIDFKKFFDITVTKHLANYWPENPFPVWYSELFND